MDGDADLKDKRALLDSIPGLGERTITILLAFFADLECCGYALLRKSLYMPAMVALVQNRLGYMLPRTLGGCW